MRPVAWPSTSDALTALASPLRSALCMTLHWTA
jgi:hypothetical protein